MFLEQSNLASGCQDIRNAFGKDKISVNNARTDSSTTEPGCSTQVTDSIDQSLATSKSGQSISAFSGKGKPLCAGATSSRSNGPIVRRLPGIGVVTNERCVATKNNVIPSNDQNDNSDDDIILYSPQAEKAVHSRSHPCTKPGAARQERSKFSDTLVSTPKSSSNRQNKRQLSVIDSDSDKEFDDVLKNLHKKRKVAKRMNKSSSLSQLSSKSPVGSCQKITNFMSVSNPKSPQYLHEKYKAAKRTGYNRHDKVTDFASNRNLRAHDLITSSSDEQDCDDDHSLNEDDDRDDGDWNDVEAEEEREKPEAGTAVDTDVSDSELAALLQSAEEFTAAGASNSAAADVQVARVSCPVCGVQVPETKVNDHLDRCLGMA